jgi:hypothetical protein
MKKLVVAAVARIATGPSMQERQRTEVALGVEQS